MRRILIIAAVIGLLAGLLPSSVLADDADISSVGISLHGFYRVRYDNSFKLSWIAEDEDDDSDWWSYIDQRMLLQSTFLINDPISIHTELNILDNVMWGNNAQILAPVVVTERKPNEPETIDHVRFDALTFNTGNVFSASVTDTDRWRSEVTPIKVRQLYSEVMLPIGFLRIGRMSSHFGMGLFSNSGSPFLRSGPRSDINDINSGFDADGGDIYDRALFGTRIAGIYYPILIYDRVAEDDFRTGTNDVHAFSFVQYVRGVTFADSGSFDGGLFIHSRSQQSTDASIWVYDLYLKLGYAGFALETEAAALQGTMTMIDNDTIEELEENGLPTGEGGGEISAEAYLGAARFNYQTRFWGSGLEYGFSSPADPNRDNEFGSDAAGEIAYAIEMADTDEDNAAAQIDFIDAVVQNQRAFGRHVYTFPFDNNYNVDLICWELLMGGAVENGMYFKLGGYIRPIDGMQVNLDVINSYINESWQDEDGNDAAHDLGWEADLTFNYTFYKRFTTGFQFGYFWPGQYFYDNYDQVHDVYTLQLRSIIDF